VITRYPHPGSPPTHRQFRLVVLFLLFTLVLDAKAHSLIVNPTLPTSNDTVTIVVTGDWPEGGGPAITQWSQSGTSIRIDAFGVLPGIPQPITSYELPVSIGRLPPGQYHVDYYLDVLAAPGPPPGLPGPPLPPVASLDFEVLAVSTAIPTLSRGAFIILCTLLLLLTILIRPGPLTSRQPSRL